jgi:hypothetical protein
MQKLKKSCGLLLASSFIVVSAHAQNTILFNSLGGRPGGSDLIFGAGPIAESFSTTSGSLDLVDVIVNLTDGGSVGSGTTTISLFSNNPSPGGPFPGTLLATIGSVSDSQLSSSFQGFNISLASPYALAPNTRYWIELSSTSSSTAQWAYTFNGSGVGVASEFFNNSSGTSPTLSGPYSMEALAAPVPEPSTLAILGLSALVLVYTARRKAAAR